MISNIRKETGNMVELVDKIKEFFNEIGCPVKTILKKIGDIVIIQIS